MDNKLTNSNPTILDELLNVFWLRPETALWRSIDIEIMKDFDFSSPSLDLGCGDGIYSFIRGGGKFDMTFDAFQSVESIDHYFDKVDIYNSSTKINPLIIKNPEYQIDYAFDHKINLLEKGKTLGLYKNFVQGDANKKLPFNDDYFNSIFSNIIYWLDDPGTVFGEIYRILKPGGCCCVMLPNYNFKDFSFYYDYCVNQQNKKYQFLEYLDRGNMSMIKHVKNKEDWGKIIQNSGLEVISHKMHLSRTTIQIWNVGLRPLFPLLYKMVTNIDKEKIIEIKKEWIETLKLFIEPISRMDSELTQNTEPAFHCFILRKDI